MLKRTLSTIILWSLVLVCVLYLGPTGGVWLVAIISLLTQREFYALLERMGLHPFNRLGLLFGAAITLAPAYFFSWISTGELLALAVIAFSVRILGEREPHNRVETLAWTLFGLVYVPFMLQFLSRVLLIPGPHEKTGLVLGCWLIAVTKFCDTGALLTGLAIGQHKMAPNISPKKTWEGAAGGVISSVIVGVALAWLCRAYLPANFTWWLAAATAVPLAGLAIVADLIESIIKRRADIKDTGRAIPGIGGIFDLSDSLILAAPVGWAVFHQL
ncbi:MAG: phosphatidate cytidylyltransferase [Verrucomicrobia bacterium RIFCSPLOWO2_12_FULL_64_8]|nr:MAG: phosphatidate cytidylyltransferase [Verrucomicrobia bacterium RIFCSPLOWO2_12_FULL_64_8]